jgi:hypothetical protein
MSLAIHTDAPLIPLTHMVMHDGMVEIGKAARGGPDCMEGWAEVQSSKLCRPHHVVYGIDDETTLWIARTLVALGHDVVVTAPTGPDQFGDHAEVANVPRAYTSTHEH